MREHRHSNVEGRNPGDRGFEVFFDGTCPLCRREMRRLRWLDRQQRIRFTDIATPAFEAEAIGVSWATLMTRVHARLPDGGMVHGTEAFRRLYSAVGLGPVVALTRLPGIRQLADLAYRWVARHRMQLGGKCRDGGRDTHS